MSSSRKILHLSDPHFGRADSTVVSRLISQVAALDPDLVVISGDLTQRAKVSQFKKAREFLDSLPVRWLAVPGNHDIPLFNIAERFSSPLRRYQSIISADPAPIYRDDALLVLGVSSVRRFRRAEGHLAPNQLRRIEKTFANAPSDLTRLLVIHHPPREMRDSSLYKLGIDVILTGHCHNTRSETSKRFFPFEHRATLLVEAGTATSTRLRGETNSFNLLTCHAGDVRVRQHGWDPLKCDFVPMRENRFALRDAGWEAEHA